MKVRSRLSLIAIGVLFPAFSTTAATTNFTVRSVMTGQSSVSNDQVWVRADATATGIPSDCYYGGLAYFYVNDSGNIDKMKALSLLVTAQATKTQITIDYGVISSSATFWGFGITKCVIERIGLGL